MEHEIVDEKTWVERRIALLKKEKEFTRLRDELNEERRRLPWVQVESDYVFQTNAGEKKLADLFGTHDQLIIQHFMFGADWEAGCKSCSFWADNYNGITEHLNARNIAFVTVSIADLETLNAYKSRMGWSFEWVSSKDSEFNRDFGVTFTEAERESGEMNYNFAKKQFPSLEAPGVSSFYRDEKGDVFRTYSTYSRGLDILNGAYHYIDVAPFGRDEAALDYPMSWLKRRDEY